MKTLEWLSESEFVVDGVKFECCIGDYSKKSDSERLILLKDRSSLEQYAKALDVLDSPPANVLEFGIFQGGSPALFTLWYELDKFVGIDICAPVAPFDDFCRTHAAGDKIRSYYGVSQKDGPRVAQIVRTEFADAALDVVIDDASHTYAYTRRTFEIAFPLLRAGGMYVIEDWGWAHWSGHDAFSGQTAMSMLIMELVMLCASRPDLVSEIRIFPAFAFIHKSPHAPSLGEFRLSEQYRKRGIALMGEKNLNLKGAAELLSDRIAHTATRQLKSLHRRARRALTRSP